MEFSVKKGKYNNKAKFIISGFTPISANVLRKYMMKRVKTMAIDKVTIYENSFSMFDEYIAHRIGLVPIKSKKELKGDEEVIFSLNVSGPKRIYSGDIESIDDNFSVANTKILLFELFEDQNIRLEGIANTNTGGFHSKYASCVASYEIISQKSLKYNFEVETYHQHEPVNLLKNAVDEIIKDCEVLKQELAGMAESGQMR